MKKGKTILSLLLALALVFAATGCGKSGGSHSPSDPGSPSVPSETEEPKTEKYSLLKDCTFAKGFRVSSYSSKDDTVYPGEIHYDKTREEYEAAGGEKPDWVFAQWGVRNAIAPDTIASVRTDGAYSYTTDTLGLTVNTDTGALKIALDAGEEYDSPRVDGQEWPHALIEQSIKFDDSPFLDTVDTLTLTLDYTVERADNLMGSDYDAGRHAAQFQWFLSVRNSNRESADYGDRMWFGLAVYDSRYEWTQKSLTVDGGKGDATGRAIYIVRSSMYLGDATEVGRANGLEYDIMSQLRTALKEVKEFDGVDVFGDTTLADLKVDSMNLGWELPGTFDAAVGIDKLGIQYTLNK